VNAYEERRQARIERLQERADRAHAEADRLIQAGDDALSLIPLGQPILIGHHSEKSDRAYRGRAFGKIERGMDLEKKARQLDRRAEAAASNRTISADDPDAPAKIRARLRRLEELQQTMKNANRIIQGKPRNVPTDEKIAALVGMGFSQGRAVSLFRADFCGRLGFPAYELQNNNANIRRLRGRIEELEVRADDETTETEYSGFTVREDADLNRVQILFPGKPEEQTRTMLKSHGFRWAPSEGAWQRQLNAAGRYAMQEVVRRLTA
jgi:hypothetical protein